MYIHKRKLYEMIFKNFSLGTGKCVDQKRRYNSFYTINQKLKIELYYYAIVLLQKFKKLHSSLF